MSNTNVKKIEIKFIPEKREIKKEEMFADRGSATARRDFIHNYFVKSLLEYDTEKAKAYQALLSDIKRLAENAKSSIRLK
ncbi:MAG TPA: hypothetical protein PLP73_00285 [Candidatus Absconditabacterales bacterium]|jgi:hypothetical protein|nr:hypothetical protein [Candidatus Absconditabacterales bacterium]HRU50022.1 hypothetical protein [Candidatus Absconditabacterales bacterium]